MTVQVRVNKPITEGRPWTLVSMVSVSTMCTNGPCKGHILASTTHCQQPIDSPAKESPGVPMVVQWLMNQLVSMRTRVRSLAMLSGLRIQCCRDLWCRSQTWLRSGIAVAMAVASSCSSNLTSRLVQTSRCRGCGPKKKIKKKKKKESPFRELFPVHFCLLLIGS